MGTTAGHPVPADVRRPGDLSGPGRGAATAARTPAEPPARVSFEQVVRAVGEGAQRVDRTRLAGLLAPLGWQTSFPDGDATAATVHTTAVDRVLVVRYDGSPFTATRMPAVVESPDPVRRLAVVEVVHEGTGRCTGGGVERAVGPGDVVLHPPRGAYQLAWTSPRCRRTYCVLQTAVFGRRSGTVLRPEDLVQHDAPLAPVVGALADLLLEPEVEPLVRAGAGDALRHLLRGAVVAAIDRGDDVVDQGLRERVRAVLLERFRDPALDADAVARELRISRRHLFAQFEGATDTFATTLRDIRLERATELLVGAEGGWAMRRVARESGFAGPAQLARAFRERYGMTPTQFRAAALRGDRTL